jgi:nucleoid-associated protein YejK
MMVKDNQITIHRMIVHKVDHNNYDQAQLSDVESPISDEVASFLRQHIISNREHKYSRSAVFQDEKVSGKSFKDICDTLLQHSQQFVDQSQVIAERLFNAMKKDKRTSHFISPGDLVVCTFSEGGDNNPQWLALLKMDPEDGFVGERITLPDGKIQTVLRRVPNVLPTGELQKCAFILPEVLRKPGLDLKVLDQQATRYGVSRLVASFFLIDFLQCKVEVKPFDQTQSFIYGSQEWVDRKKDQWPESDFNRFKERTTTKVYDEQVDLTEFAKEVIPLEKEQDDYLDFMKRKGIEDLTFKPDPEIRSRLTRYIWFEGDNGLRIRIEAEAIGEGKTLYPVFEKDVNSWMITINTATWKRRIRGR